MQLVIERLDTDVESPVYAFDKGTSGFDLIPTDLIKLYNGQQELPEKEFHKRIQYSYQGNSSEPIDNIILAPFERALFKTRQQFVIPEGYEIQIRPKSGITLKTGIFVSLGSIDQSYFGDLSISVYNSNNQNVSIELGHKPLAQGVLCKVERALFNTISKERFDEYEHKSERGTAGFGSTTKE